MAKPDAMTPAGASVQRWLVANSRSQQWLADELNRRRVKHGIEEKIGRSTLWRWMTGKNLINIDDATLIERITGTPVTMWSKYDAAADQAPPSAAA